MELIVDGIVYLYQTNGGISRIFDNILPLMCELDPNLKVKLFNARSLAKRVPQHINISQLFLNNWDRSTRPWRLRRKVYSKIHNFILKSLIGDTRGKIWFSTYYTVPPFNWEGHQIVCAYDFIYELFPSLLPDSATIIPMKKDAILKADAVICISYSTAKDLVKYYPLHESKIFVAKPGYNYIFKQRSKEEIRNKINAPFILYVGNRNYHKNFGVLLSAYAQWKEHQEVKLIAIGPSWSSDEKNFIKNNKLSNQVLLLQGIDDDILCDLYNQALAFIYPSLYEGFGLPVLEALACGCPIVASQIASTLEVANELPFYFKPSDQVGLINALNQAINDGKEIERIRRGLSIASQYSWDRTASKILEVFKTVSGVN